MEAAASAHQFAGEPLGIVGSQERGDTGDIVHLTEAAQWGLGDDAFLEVRADETRGLYAFGLNHARVDGVDADLLRAQLLRQHARDRINRALGRRVHRGVRRRHAGDERTDIDDAGAFAKVLDRGLRGEQQTKDVDVENLAVVFFGDAFDGGEFVDARVVDQDVKAAEVLDGCVNNALRAALAGYFRQRRYQV